MAKNREFIEYQKQLNKNLDAVVPEIYGVFAIALYRIGFGVEDIKDLFNETQELWEIYGRDAVNVCENETGIVVQLNRDKQYAKR